MNKKELGEALKSEIKKGYDVVRISRWAFHLFSTHIRELDPYLTQVLQNLFSMEDDPQFEISENDLLVLADTLITDGEKEELNHCDLSIKDTALNLGSHWLMCPLCQDSWEFHDLYQMVICPKCNTKLNNPYRANKNF